MSSPRSLGQLDSGYWFNDISSRNITLKYDATKPKTPINLTINFNTQVEVKDEKIKDLRFHEFYISLLLTLDVRNGKIDLFSWKDDLDNLKFEGLPEVNSYRVTGQFLGSSIDKVLFLESPQDLNIALSQTLRSSMS